jgi:hypothetical protein
MKDITLLAFGDSHTAGAEIDYKHQGECYDKAFPAKLANLLDFKYENYAKSGGSNGYLISCLMSRVQCAIANSEKVFVVIGFCEPSRILYKSADGNMRHLTSSSFNHTNDGADYYSKYLQTYTNDDLNVKSLNDIILIQTFLKSYNIPFIFFMSTTWYYGDWSLIDQKTFFGHKKMSYTERESWETYNQFGYWGNCMHHPSWSHYKNDPRWSGHYPEEFHKFWANLMLDFIKTNNILNLTP